MLHINRGKPGANLKGTNFELCLYRHASSDDIRKE